MDKRWQRTCTLVTFTKNEAEGCKVILPQVDTSWCERNVLIDAHSTDGTQEIARSYGFEVIPERPRGPRAAFVEFMKTCDTDLVLTYSPDGNSPPADIPRILDKMDEGYDMVIASRYLPPASSADDDFMSGMANWGFTKAINVLYGGHYTDAMTLYRAYTTAMFKDLQIHDARAYWPERRLGIQFGIEPLVAMRAARKGYRIGEIPSDEPPRIHGESRVHKYRGAVVLTAQLLTDWRRRY